MRKKAGKPVVRVASPTALPVTLSPVCAAVEASAKARPWTLKLASDPLEKKRGERDVKHHRFTMTCRYDKRHIRKKKKE